MNKKVLAIALIFALLFSAIPITSVKAQGIPNPETFTYARVGNAETCDPAWAYDTASGELIFNVYEPLIGFDNERVDAFVPMLAEWWPGYGTTTGNAIIPSPPDPAAPGPDTVLGIPGTVKTWYFKIDTSIPWQDPAYGTVEVADVEFSFERGMVMDHDGGPQWMIFEPLLTIMTVREYDLTDPIIVGALGQAIDNAVQSGYRTDLGGGPGDYVWFNLRQSYSETIILFQQILAQTWGCILNKDWVVANDDDWEGWVGPDPYHDWLLYNDPLPPGPLMNDGEPNGPDAIGTGPYMLDYWDIDQDIGSYRLVKFDDYWQGWSPHPHVSEAIVKTVLDWPARKTRFISEAAEDQVDTCDVPVAYVPELYGEYGVRFVKGLDTLSADAMFFNTAVDPTSPFVPLLGGVPNTILFSDRDMRLAFSYSVDMTKYINEVFMGEAKPRGNPIIKGIPYYNPSKPFYDQDLDKARFHFQQAWGGQVWEQGFTAYVTYDRGSKERKAFAEMLAYFIEDVIWPLNPNPQSLVDIIPVGRPWSVYFQDLYTNQLGCFIMGWQTSFPDPHSWMMPFMHTDAGHFASHQNIVYSMGNAFVNGGIETGIQLLGGPLRQSLYNGLMDIFFDECFTKMIVQPLGQHWERDWLQGWFYNPLRPGYYIYDLWKQDPTQVVWDVSCGIRKEVYPGDDYLYGYVHNKGGWDEVYIHKAMVVEIASAPGAGYKVDFLNGATGSWTARDIDGGARREITIDAYAWIRKCIPTDLIKVTVTSESLVKKATDPVSFVCIQAENMTPIPDWHPEDNYYEWTHTIGDLGSLTAPGGFGNYDGLCNYEDASLFRYAYVEEYHPLADFNADIEVNYEDASIFRQCYLGAYG